MSALIEKGTLRIDDGYRVRRAELGPDGIPFVRGGDIGNGDISTSVDDHIRPELTDRVQSKLARPLDVAFISKGTVGRVGMLRPGQPEVVFSPQVCYWRSLDFGEINSRFLFYLLTSHEFQSSLHAVMTHGSMAADYVSLADQRNFKLTFPPIETQNAIASILGALDDKIELNRRMNATLESLARAIFKSWFVDFDPVKINAGQLPASSQALATHDAKVLDLFPSTFQDSKLGPIPEGWNVGPLSTVADLRTDSVKPNQSPDTEWELYSIPAFDENNQPSIDLGETIKSNKYAVPENCVLVSKLNPRFPRVWVPSIQNSEVAICSTEFMPFVPHDETNRAFLFECICSEGFHTEMLGRTTGSTGSRQRVKPKEVAEISIVVPDVDSLLLFSERITPVHDQIAQNRSEAIDLARLRDALLPQLLSGELPVAVDCGAVELSVT